jgi:hypothetical protein
MTAPFHFKLANGLKATLHPPNSPIVEQIMKTRTAKGHFKISLLFAVEIKVKNERLYVIYWSGFITPNYIVKELEKDLQYALGYNFGISYNNIMHSIADQTTDSLVQAIINNEKPNLAPLLYEQKQGTDWWKKYVRDNQY